MANGSGIQCIRHLKGFADSNDAIQGTAVEAEHTVSTTNWDFFLVHVNLEEEEGGEGEGEEERESLKYSKDYGQ